MTDDVQVDVRAELEAAVRAREDGNEGMARVCARRAAGWAIGLVHGQFAEGEQPPNAYHLLQWFSSKEDAPEALRQAAKRLTTRITPAHTLPHPDDPLEDAQAIVQAMLGARNRGAESDGQS
jgi:hypothetical protein